MLFDLKVIIVKPYYHYFRCCWKERGGRQSAVRRLCCSWRGSYPHRTTQGSLQPVLRIWWISGRIPAYDILFLQMFHKLSIIIDEILYLFIFIIYFTKIYFFWLFNHHSRNPCSYFTYLQVMWNNMKRLFIN